MGGAVTASVSAAAGAAGVVSARAVAHGVDRLTASKPLTDSEKQEVIKICREQIKTLGPILLALEAAEKNSNSGPSLPHRIAKSALSASGQAAAALIETSGTLVSTGFKGLAQATSTATNASATFIRSRL